ncbi:aldose 1-epimerase [Flaviflexus massiliensis]|uniref:aldose 1-epimerase n=1 Tax=Flaviflexus massiliensis TaxID=1522309 RepID=UPI0006D54F8C|nr:aldose 1-epimerase [Flaviflexus massiliensis]
MDHPTITEVDFGGNAWRLEHDGASATIAARGATLLDWDPGTGHSVIAGFVSPEELRDGQGSRSRILAPYPGRIKNGTFTWGGRTTSLPTQSDGHARHGFIDKLEFEAISTRSTLQLRAEHLGDDVWPWSFALDVVYALGSGGPGVSNLSITLKLTNLSPETAPAGLGWHPLFQFPNNPKITNLSLTVPARTAIATTQDLIPQPGEAAYSGIHAPVVVDRIGDQQFDSIYTGLVPNDEGVVRTSIIEPKSNHEISLSQEPGEAPYIVVWTGEGLKRGYREAIALEPYSHIPDAVNRADAKALMALAPGKSRAMTATVSFT